MTCRRSGTGRPAVAEDGGSGDHCPNQLLQDQLFTGTGRACDREKSRKPQFREPPTPVAEEATHSLAPRERGWPLRLKGPFHSPIEVNTRSTGFSGWHMSVAVPRRHACMPEKEHSSIIKFLTPTITRGPDLWRSRPGFPATSRPAPPFSIPRCVPPHLGTFAAPARCRDSPRKVEKSGQEKRLHYKSDSSAISSIFASSSGSTSPSSSEFDAMNWAAHCKTYFVRNSLLLVRSAKVTR